MQTIPKHIRRRQFSQVFGDMDGFLVQLQQFHLLGISSGGTFAAALKVAPPAAQDVVRRLTASR